MKLQHSASHFKTNALKALITLLFIAGSTTFTWAQQNKDALTILNLYAKDYQSDPTFKNNATFGVIVDNVFYTVNAIAGEHGANGTVTVTQGKPNTPVFFFYTDINTLNKIEQGKMNALTGSAKAFQTDSAPFDIDVMEGFTPDEDFTNTLFKIFFHFWTRGMPERIPYGLDLTRFTHGAQASIFYYQEGFRSGYFAIKQGQHANKDEKSQTNPFPSLLIVIKGEGQMIIDGKKSKLSAGEAILIPAGISHEFLNPNKEPVEGILLMFGDGA